jgi:stearoyl-CoA desaturase (delta-9 desaturase)
MNNPIETKARRIKLNWPAIFVILLYPAVIIALVGRYLSEYNFGWKEAAILALGYYVTNISVGIGFHRLWSHNAYKTKPWVEFILMLLTAGTLQGPVLVWASDHRKHHAFTDTDQDPHTPSKYKNKWLGFLWSHVGWMILSEARYDIDRVTVAKLGRKKVLLWQLKHYWGLATFMNIIPPMILGYLMIGGTQGLFAGFVFIALGRAIQQQMTFCVNSLCHIIGTRKYTKGTARDIWWLFFLLLGENWHNFHHAFAQDYRNGIKWYHADVHKWIICLMEKMGLAWDLVRTSEERVAHKVQEAKFDLAQAIEAKLQKIEERATALAQIACQRLKAMEESAKSSAENFNEKLKQLEENATLLLERARGDLRESLNNFNGKEYKRAKKFVKQAKSKLAELESIAQNLGLTRNVVQ